MRGVESVPLMKSAADSELRAKRRFGHRGRS